MHKIVLLVLVSVAAMQAPSRRDDPYGTFHLQLNAVPGQPGPPDTEWLNMGFWKVIHKLNMDNIQSNEALRIPPHFLKHAKVRSSAIKPPLPTGFTVLTSPGHPSR